MCRELIIYKQLFIIFGIRVFIFLLFVYIYILLGAHDWLKHCAANRKVTGSISDGGIRIFVDIILPAALDPVVTKHLTEMSTRNTAWEVNVAGAWG
jgi:hypothetical protein